MPSPEQLARWKQQHMAQSQPQYQQPQPPQQHYPPQMPGQAMPTAETISVPAELVKDQANTFVLRVQGDSMINEQIRDGDYVIVEQRDAADDGETVVALIDGSEATLKRLYRESSMVRLQPSNSEMSSIIVPAEKVRVQGVVVGVIRKYR